MDSGGYMLLGLVGLVAISVGLYFWGLKRSAAGDVVIYADEKDAAMGGLAATMLVVGGLIIPFIAQETIWAVIFGVVAIGYPLFWVMYRSAIYNPNSGKFWLALLLRLNAVLLQVLSFVVFIALMAFMASENDKKRKRGEHVSAAAEGAQLAFVSLLFAILFYAIPSKGVSAAAPPYRGVLVPARLQGTAIALWGAVMLTIATPMYAIHWNHEHPGSSLLAVPGISIRNLQTASEVKRLETSVSRVLGDAGIVDESVLAAALAEADALVTLRPGVGRFAEMRAELEDRWGNAKEVTELKSAVAVVAAGALRQTEEDLRAALTKISKLLVLRPDDKDVLDLRIRIQGKLVVSEVQRAMAKADKLCPGLSAVANAARADDALAQCERALAVLADASVIVEMSLGNPWVESGLRSGVNLQRGKVEALVRDASARRSEASELWSQGVAHWRRGEQRDALEKLKTSVDLWPSSEKSREVANARSAHDATLRRVEATKRDLAEQVARATRQEEESRRLSYAREAEERRAEDRQREVRRATEHLAISGIWRSNLGNVQYEMSQAGNRIYWRSLALREAGEGVIDTDRRRVRATYNGSRGHGAVGGFVQTGSDGRATRIVWDNGVVLTR